MNTPSHSDIIPHVALPVTGSVAGCVAAVTAFYTHHPCSQACPRLFFPSRSFGLGLLVSVLVMASMGTVYPYRHLIRSGKLLTLPTSFFWTRSNPG